MSMLVGARILLNKHSYITTHCHTLPPEVAEVRRTIITTYNMTTTNYLTAKRPVGPNTPAV